METAPLSARDRRFQRGDYHMGLSGVLRLSAVPGDQYLDRSVIGKEGSSSGLDKHRFGGCRPVESPMMKLLSVLLAAVLLGSPLLASAQSNRPVDDSLSDVRILLSGGRFESALAILRVLVRDERADRTNILFLTGIAALGAAKQKAEKDEREAFLDRAITAFRTILIESPGLVRVRLELARAFFLKGDDDLARTHFEQVLAGRPPPPVVGNINRFLSQIRERRRWSSYFGFALAPDSNIGAASESDIVYIFGLPFRREGHTEVSSGVGLSLWGGGEYQYPVTERTRVRMGVAASRREYANRDFDQTFAAVHLGPRWLLSRNTDVSLLGTAHQRWTAGKRNSHAFGTRLELWRRLSPRLTARGRVSWQNRRYRTNEFQDGPVRSISAGGTLVASPTVRVNGTVGYEHARTRSERNRNDTRWLRAGVSKALPRGFTVGASGELRWTSYGEGWLSVPNRGARHDRTRILRVSLLNRSWTVFGFSPQVVLVNEARSTNAQIYDYRRNRAELQFQRQF